MRSTAVIILCSLNRKWWKYRCAMEVAAWDDSLLHNDQQSSVHSYSISIHHPMRLWDAFEYSNLAWFLPQRGRPKCPIRYWITEYYRRPKTVLRCKSHMVREEIMKLRKSRYRSVYRKESALAHPPSCLPYPNAQKTSLPFSLQNSEQATYLSFHSSSNFEFHEYRFML